MKEHDCVSSEGEHLVLLQNEEGAFLCPVCGAPEFDEPPYNTNGDPSFQTSSCGFKFGLDDSNLTSEGALSGIADSWARWRLKLIQKKSVDRSEFKTLQYNLGNIGYKLAFDLLPVRIDENT